MESETSKMRKNTLLINLCNKQTLYVYDAFYPNNS